MLHSLKELQGFNIRAKDGEIGKVTDFYFDDTIWKIRYLVVDTGKWIPGRQVLIAPITADKPDLEEKVFPVDLTREQVKESPDVDLRKPVSRQQEKKLSKYYNWPLYWLAEDDLPGMGGYSPEVLETIEKAEAKKNKKNSHDPHLRSTRVVSNYQIQARNGSIGHVEDFIIDDQSWRIVYMVVDTQNWLPGKKVLVSPGWIELVNWDDAKVHIELTREVIQNSPEFDYNRFLNHELSIEP